MSHATVPPYKVVKVKSIVKGPFCSPWRHPIWWWKMRHMRADIRVLDQINPDLSSKMREMEDDRFLRGSGR